MRWRVDIAVALGIAAVGQVDVWKSSLTGANIVGPRPAVAGFYLLTALALAWRRRHPFAVAMVVVAANIVQSLAIGTSEGQGVLLPAVLALYFVGANEDRPRSLVPLALMPLVILARELRNPENVDVANVLDALAWESLIIAAWLLGAYLRTRRLYVAELRERARRAELDREERARAAVADERARIARELHDAIAHGVSVMVVQAEAAEEILAVDPERARGPLRKVQRSGREALVELRRLVGMLRELDSDAERSPQPSLTNLDALVDTIRESGLPVDLRIEGTPTPLPTGLDLSAYRILQEALTNALKHAGPAQATVTVRFGRDVLELDVSDDGYGAAAANGGGHGLAGMRERVALYSGELETGPQPGRGYRVRAQLPLPQ